MTQDEQGPGPLRKRLMELKSTISTVEDVIVDQVDEHSIGGKIISHNLERLAESGGVGH